MQLQTKEDQDYHQQPEARKDKEAISPRVFQEITSSIQVYEGGKNFVISRHPFFLYLLRLHKETGFSWGHILFRESGKEFTHYLYQLLEAISISWLIIATLFQSAKDLFFK
jgi:hypothetical protein